MLGGLPLPDSKRCEHHGGDRSGQPLGGLGRLGFGHVARQQIEAGVQNRIQQGQQNGRVKCMRAGSDDDQHPCKTSQNGDPVVMLSLADYNSMMETMHLVSSPSNAKRLSESIAQHRAGKAKERGLIDNGQEK